jgi:hypothetical protein
MLLHVTVNGVRIKPPRLQISGMTHRRPEEIADYVLWLYSGGD